MPSAVVPTIRVQREDFDLAAEVARLTGGRTDVGAVVTFTGLCRDEEGSLTALELEHYPGMAEGEMERIAEDALDRWPLTGLTVVHRFGRIRPGENIVLVVAASHHRQAAFEAASFLMDYLKTRAPFWKKEHPRSGAEGERSRLRGDGEVAKGMTGASDATAPAEEQQVREKPIMKEPVVPDYPVDDINRVRRRHDRGFYDHATIHPLLDAAALAHVAYVVDGRPFCTPTLFWREGTRLYWHGSSASRMLRNISSGEPACVTITHFDSIVLARSGFNHSADYRSVMAFGTARLVEDPEEKRRALVMMVDRFFPGRTAGLRPSTAQEIKATSVLVMEIERASAKIRNKGVADDEEDYDLPVYAERLPIKTTIGEPEGCPRLVPGVERPENLAPYRAGRLLEEALGEAHALAYQALDGSGT